MKKWHIEIFVGIIFIAVLLCSCGQEQSKEFYGDTKIETFTSFTGVELNIEENYPESDSISYNYLMDNNAAGLGNIIKYEAYLKESGFEKIDSLSSDDHTTYKNDDFIVITGSFNPQSNVIQYIVNIAPIRFSEENTISDPAPTEIREEGTFLENYETLVSLVEGERFSEAYSFYNNHASYDFMHYKDTSDYYHYAEAMNYFTDQEFRPLVEVREILKNKVSNGFLRSAEIISVIDEAFSSMNDVYELNKGNFSHYLMIKDGEVYYTAARSTPTSGTYLWELASATLGNTTVFMISGGYYGGIDGCSYAIVDNGSYLTLVKPAWQADGTYAGNYTKIQDRAP